MMPDRDEVLRSLYGAYRLACLDGDGLQYFNLSVEGFWRSFFAALLVAPGYVILIGEKVSEQFAAIHLGRVVLIQTIAYVISWVAFPLAALVITDWLQLSRHYAVLIIAINWATVLQVGLFLVALLLVLILPHELGSMALMVVIGAALFYHWFVTRTALQTTDGVAFALALFSFLLDLLISMSAERLM